MSNTNEDYGQFLHQEVRAGEARLFDMLYLRVSQGDSAISAAVVQCIDPNGPMKALWIMANVNVTRRRQRFSLFTAPFRWFRSPPSDPLSEQALQSLAEAVREKVDSRRSELKAA